MPTVNIYGHDIAFPDDMTPEQLNAAAAQAAKQLAPQQDAPQQAPPPAPQPSFLHGISTGLRDVIEGAGAVPGMAYDIAAMPINAGISGVNALTGADIPRIRPAAENLSRIADAVGLDKPQTGGQRVISDINRAVAGLIPSMGGGLLLQGGKGVGTMIGDALVGAPASQVAGSAASGLASGSVRENGGTPGQQLGAALLGGVAGAAAPLAGGVAAQTVRALVQPFANEGRQGMIAEALLRASSDPETLAARINAGTQDAGRRLPGAPVTTATAARDPGLAILENTARSNANTVPGVMSSAVALRDVEAGRDALRNATMARLLRGTELDPAARGATVRDATQAAGEALAGRANQLYEAIPKNQRFDIQPIRDAMTAIGQRFGPLSGGMSGELGSVADDLAKFGGTASWRDLQDLRSRLGEVAGRAAMAQDRRTASAAGELRDAIDGLAGSSQWQTATDFRRRMGALLGRDDAGASATGAILKNDRFGAPMTPDAAVIQKAVADPASARQVMEAQYAALDAARRQHLPPEQIEALAAGMRNTRQAMKDQFITNMQRSAATTSDVADAAGNVVNRLTPAGFSRFWRDHQRTAAVLFDAKEKSVLDRLAQDFAESTIAPATARARGSDTAQNFSVGNFIARASRGLIDPQNPTVRTLAGGPIVSFLLKSPESAMQAMMTEALRNPKFAASLLNKATPQAIEQAAGYLQTTMAQRAKAAALAAGIREVPRAAQQVAAPPPWLAPAGAAR